jgi:hypothetical protein
MHVLASIIEYCQNKTKLVEVPVTLDYQHATNQVSFLECRIYIDLEMLET